MCSVFKCQLIFVSHNKFTSSDSIYHHILQHLQPDVLSINVLPYVGFKNKYILTSNPSPCREILGYLPHISCVPLAHLWNELSKHINTSTLCCTKTWMSPENLYYGTLSASLASPTRMQGFTRQRRHSDSSQRAGRGFWLWWRGEMKAWLMFPGQFHSPQLPAARERERRGEEKRQPWTVNLKKIILKEVNQSHENMWKCPVTWLEMRFKWVTLGVPQFNE